MHFKMLENLAIKTAKDNNMVKTYIICPGFLYGCGEEFFYDYYKVPLQYYYLLNILDCMGPKR